MHTGPSKTASQDRARKLGNAKRVRADIDRAFAHYLRRYAKQVKRANRESQS